MTDKEIYDGLRELVTAYISGDLHKELLAVLNEREKAGDFPPGKGIIAAVISHSNGVKIKDEHRHLWRELCHYCV